MTRRVSNPHDPRRYCEIRIKLLQEERAKNDDHTAHMVLDNAIYELSIVLDLIVRSEARHP